MLDNKTKIEYLSIDKLIPYARNTRTHNKEQVLKIASSIKEFGFTNPILIDKDNGIIAGHGRVLAAEKLNIKELPCIRLGYLTDAQKKAYIIADNRLALDAGWDEELLKIELEELKELDFDIELTGFSDKEFNEIFKEEIEEDEFDADKALEDIKEPITKRGDIWKLGRHRLMCGDSTDKEDVLKLMDGVKADLYITDPPYNVALGANFTVEDAKIRGRRTDGLIIKNDNMDDDKFRIFLSDAFAAADQVLKPGGVFYIWHADNQGYNFRGACIDMGWKVRQCLIWNKNALVMGRQDYQWKHEPCLYGWKEGAGHLWATDRKQTTIIDYDRPSRSDVHPTMKPIGLFDYQIKNNTKGEDIVLDSFMGSGTTIMACEQNGRIGYGLELDEKYCDVIIKRYEEYTGNKAVLVNE